MKVLLSTRAPSNPWLTVLLYCLLADDSCFVAERKKKKSKHARSKQVKRPLEAKNAFFCQREDTAFDFSLAKARIDVKPSRMILLSRALPRMSLVEQVVLFIGR